MIYRISGIVAEKGSNFAVIDFGGVGFKVFSDQRTLKSLAPGERAELFSFLHVKEDALDLYGFRTAAQRSFFELLISVSGVGPKSALAVFEVGEIKEIAAAIHEGRPDLLTRAPGIGRKIAERIILELRSKVQSAAPEAVVQKMESDTDIEEALVGLGYRRDEARQALKKVDAKVVKLEDRLKAAMKVLAGKK